MLFRNNNTGTTNDNHPVSGPGQRLSRARQAWGMSREQVASTLRLTPSVVAALEEDRYDGLPPPAFVRGYLSGYARLVGLDAGELVSSCRTHECGNPALRSKTAPKLGRGRGEALLRWLSYAGLGGFILLAIGYWIASENERPNPLPVGLSDPSALSNPIAATASTGPEVAGAPTLDPSTTPSPPTAETFAAKNSATPVDTGGARTTSPPGTLGINDTMQRNWTTLELHFSANSWVAIRDADGTRLAWETITAGSSRQLRGIAPIRVVLGNIAAVRMTVAGAPFDPSPYASGRIARFSVE